MTSIRGRWRQRWLLGVLLASALPSFPTLAQPRSVAVLPMAGEDAAALELAVRAAAEQLDGFEVWGAERTADDLEGAKALGLTCRPGDHACFGSLAVALGVDVLVVPSSTQRAGARTLTLTAYDAHTGGRLSGVEETLEEKGAARAAQVAELVGVLLVPERYLGTLLVQTGAPNAAVTLDGGAPAPGPDARFVGVRAGQHTVVVREEDRERTEVVSVVAGETVTVAIAPPLPPASPSSSSPAATSDDGSSTSPPVAAEEERAGARPPSSDGEGGGLAVLPVGVLAAGGAATLFGMAVGAAGGATALYMDQMIRAPIEGANDEKRSDRERQNESFRQPVGVAGLAVFGVGVAAAALGLAIAVAGGAWLAVESGDAE